MVDVTKQVTLTTTAVELVRFTADQVDNLNIKADADWLLYYGSGQGDGYKVLNGASLAMTWEDFSPESVEQRKLIQIFAKVSAGSTTAYVSFQQRTNR
jgi:hypothetical protein